jgi:hypothetical protein
MLGCTVIAYRYYSSYLKNAFSGMATLDFRVSRRLFL